MNALCAADTRVGVLSGNNGGYVLRYGSLREGGRSIVSCISFVNNTVLASLSQGIVYLPDPTQSDDIFVTHCLFIKNVANRYFVMATVAVAVQNCLFDVLLASVGVSGGTSRWSDNVGNVETDTRLNTEICPPMSPPRPTRTAYFTAALSFASSPRKVIKMGLFVILSSMWA
jgi:hypothetical protein